MTPLAIIGLVLELVSEAGKLGVSVLEASQEQLAEAEARCKAALQELRGTRTTVEQSIEERHQEAHKVLDATPTKVTPDKVEP